MPRILLFTTLLCASALLGGPAMADGSDPCLMNSSDPAVSFPDGSHDYVFVILQEIGGYGLCSYSPTALDMSAFTGASIADFNHDGWPDLLYGVKGSGGGEVQLFLNDKTGSGIVVLSVTLATGAAQAPMQVGTPDLNGDGWPDIVTGNGSDGTVSVMLNDGTGGFPSVKQYAAGSDITSMAVVDLDGDGHLDIVTTDYTGNAVDVLINTGMGAFKPAVAIPVGSGPYSMQIGDLNHDGHTDIVTENVLDGTVSVLLNNGDGSFTTPSTYAVSHLSFISLIDVNNDGHPDIVTDFTNSAWYALLNKGDGSFAAPAWVAMPGGSGGGVDLSTGGGTVIGGTATPISGATYISTIGTATPPTVTPTVTTTKSGSESSSSSGNSTNTGTSSTSTSGGGGAMEWLSLALLGLTGFLRRNRA